METIIVLPKNAAQKRNIEAYLLALKVQFLPIKPSLEELEARLSPSQTEIWNNLKSGYLG